MIRLFDCPTPHVVLNHDKVPYAARFFYTGLEFPAQLECECCGEVAVVPAVMPVLLSLN